MNDRVSVSRRWLIVSSAVGLLAACQSEPLPAPFPELSYGHLAPIRLAVSIIDFREEYEPPLRAPNVEHLFPTTPQGAARRWAEDRLRAVGGVGRATFVIRRASVVESKLARSTGLRAMFANDQTERYDGRLEVALEIRDERGFQEAFATAEAERNRTVAERATLHEREKAFFEMTEGLLRDMNDQFEFNIRRHLTRWVR